MKKLSILFCLFMVSLLTGCLIQESYDPVNDVLDSLSISSNVTNSFELQLVKENVELSWSSNNYAITIDDNIALVNQGKNDVSVTLTVDGVKGDLKSSRSFDVTVIKDSNYPDTVTIEECYVVSDNTNVLLENLTVLDSSTIGTQFTDGTNVIFASNIYNLEVNDVYNVLGLKVTNGVVMIQNASVTQVTSSASSLSPTNTTISNLPTSNGYYKVEGILEVSGNDLLLVDDSNSIKLSSSNISTLKLFTGYRVNLNVYVSGDKEVITYATYNSLGLNDNNLLDVIKNNLEVVLYTKLDIDLPSTYLFGSIISWSSNSVALSNTGIVNRQNSNVDVILTATIKVNNTTATKQFNLTVIDINNNYLDELFISEYYEGTSNNKYVEIYNPNNFAVDLSDYSLKTRTNGNDSYYYNNSLTGEIAPYSTIIYHHSSITSDFTDLLKENNVVYYSATACNFTGNDTIGLYFEDELIDLFGVYNEVVSSSWVVPGGTTQDHRIIRNKTTGATTVWNPDEWYATAVSSSSMFFDNAGMHSFV